MGASSVTGVGLGMSNGLQKKENHCGCNSCCTGNCQSESLPTPIKTGCVVRYKIGSGRSYTANSRAVRSKVC